MRSFGNPQDDKRKNVHFFTYMGANIIKMCERGKLFHDYFQNPHLFMLYLELLANLLTH